MGELEAQLGFDMYPPGLSVISIKKLKPPIRDLRAGLDVIKTESEGLETEKISSSTELEGQAEILFHELGPRLWPDLDVAGENPPWLFQRSLDSGSDLRRLYPKNLSYSNLDDRQM